MIPMVVVVDIRSRSHDERPHNIYLWLPLFLIWLLLLPFVLLLAPFAALALLAMRQNPVAVFGALLGLLGAANGTRIEVQSPDASVFIRVF